MLKEMKAYAHLKPGQDGTGNSIVTSLEERGYMKVLPNMPPLKVLVLTVLLLTICGCGISRKIESNQPDRTFLASSYCFQDVGKDSASSWLAVSDFWCFTPIILVDLPISFVFDTVALPYDLYEKRINKEAPHFWRSYLNPNSTDEAVVTSQSYYTRYGAKILSDLLADTSALKIVPKQRAGDIVGLAFENSHYSASGQILPVVAEHAELSDEHFRSLFDYGVHSWSLYPALASNPKTPQEVLRKLYQVPSADVRYKVLMHPGLPAAERKNLLLKVKEVASTGKVLNIAPIEREISMKLMKKLSDPNTGVHRMPQETRPR